MKFKLTSLLILLCLITAFVISCSFNGNNLHKVRVDRVMDGNTIKVIVDDKIRDVEILFVDSPNLRGNHPFSVESKKYLESKLKGSEYIYLEFDDNYEKIDSYDRIHAYVWYYNENNNLELINNSIVLEGYGRVSSPTENYKYLDQLIHSEKEAMDQKKNIWSIEGYVTETGYNKMLNKE